MRRHEREIANKLEDTKEAHNDRRDREIKKLESDEEKYRYEKDKEAKKAAQKAIDKMDE